MGCVVRRAAADVQGHPEAMSHVFCDIGVADNHPATLRHQHKALESPIATVKELGAERVRV